jgi:hypothetical protein
MKMSKRKNYLLTLKKIPSTIGPKPIPPVQPKTLLRFRFKSLNQLDGGDHVCR